MVSGILLICCIFQMKAEVDQLSHALAQQSMNHSKEIQQREEHWSNECRRIQRLSESAQLRVSKLETEKDMTISHRRDADILRAKNVELEEKIKRLEQQTKTRLLKDRTNLMHPEAISAANAEASVGVTVKPPAPPSVDQTLVVQPVAVAVPEKPDLQQYHRPQVPSSLPQPSFASRPGADSFVRPVPVRPAVAHMQSTKLHQPGCAMNPQR